MKYSPKKIFLFLQGPPCCFFSRVAGGLKKHGHHCYKIHFCAGDWFSWREPNGISFRGTLKEWKDYIEQFIINKKVTTIVLNGDKKPYHRIAIQIAQKHSISVVVTDYGYLRPGYLVLEKNGTGKDSLISKEKEMLHEIASSLPNLNQREPINENEFQNFFLIALSNILTSLFSSFYPNYCKPIDENIFVIGIGFIVQFFKKKLFSIKTHQLVECLAREAGDYPYFLFPLQLDMDFQIRNSLKYNNQAVTLKEIITSFSQYAPPHTRLVIKLHPMDPGLKPWEKLIKRLARIHHISKRVFFLYEGSLDMLLSQCCGVVTINSSVGLKAIEYGKPVKPLDQAIYDIKGLIFSGTLDRFWRLGEEVDQTFCNDFIKVITQTLQIRGDYFSKDGSALAVEQAVKRLNLDKLNQPLE